MNEHLEHELERLGATFDIPHGDIDAVVGRPVHTILLPEFQENQEGTIHFHYLLTVNGGLLRAARSLDEHVRLLAESVGRDGGEDPQARRFAAA